MENKNNKKFIILGVILIIILLGITIKISYDSRENYIVINDKVLTYNNKKWFNLNNTSKVFDKYNFNVYSNNEFKGKYEMKFFNDMWYFFDTKNDSHKFSGDLLAYGGKRRIKVLNFDIKNIDEDDISNLNEILKEKDIYINDINDLSTFQKLEYDFNKDGKKEVIYNLNNFDGKDINNKYFSTIIYISNNKNKIVLYEEEDSYYKDDLYIYNLYYLINMDNKNRIIIAAAKNLDVNSTTYLIYSFKNNNIIEEKDANDELIEVNTDDSGKIGKTVIIILLLISVIGGGTYLVLNNKQKEKNKI